MKTIRLTNHSSARELLPTAGEEEVLVLKGGHAVALVMPFDDDDAEWYSRERSAEFIESIHRARAQVKRGETVSESDLDALFVEHVDGIDLSGFSSLVSIETLQRTRCSAVPTDAGVYVVLRPTRQKPSFLAKSVGGWHKGKDPSVAAEVLRKNWIEDASILYVGLGDGVGGLQQRLREYMRFGLGKNVGHWGGRLIWQLRNYRQMFIRWRPGT